MKALPAVNSVKISLSFTKFLPIVHCTKMARRERQTDGESGTERHTERQTERQTEKIGLRRE